MLAGWIKVAYDLTLWLPPGGRRVGGGATYAPSGIVTEENNMSPLMAVAGVFSPRHIALTAAVTGVLGLLILRWRLRPLAVGESIVIALIVTASVLAWRLSANMPQMNSDGLPGFSANDWLCPVVTYVFLGLYAAARPPTDTVRWAQARALLTLAALVVNVVTI